MGRDGGKGITFEIGRSDRLRVGRVMRALGEKPGGLVILLG